MTTIGVFGAIFDARGHVLCVHQAYGERHWAMPGGRLEAGEDPVSVLHREALEEAGAVVEVDSLVGLYASTYRDDLVIVLRGRVRELRAWTPDEEISRDRLLAPSMRCPSRCRPTRGCASATSRRGRAAWCGRSSRRAWCGMNAPPPQRYQPSE